MRNTVSTTLIRTGKDPGILMGIREAGTTIPMEERYIVYPVFLKLITYIWDFIYIF